MGNRSKFWIVVFFALLTVSCAAFFMLGALRPRAEGNLALVQLDGELIETFDLDVISAAYEYTVQSEWGENRLLLEPGKISVVSADCPDKLCVRQGAIQSAGIPIICLPHRLVISIKEQG